MQDFYVEIDRINHGRRCKQTALCGDDMGIRLFVKYEGRSTHVLTIDCRSDNGWNSIRVISPSDVVFYSQRSIADEHG